IVYGELTTAAGLWASACMGLAIGAGFYIGAIVGFVLVLLTITLFSHFEGKIIASARNMNIYAQPFVIIQDNPTHNSSLGFKSEFLTVISIFCVFFDILFLHYTPLLADISVELAVLLCAVCLEK
ncbi:MAG: MgtC/SapB family protein, partial [Ruminococcus sp.]|nr:MgtC/SapB family protein [Ruminococcus sp.]